MGKGRLKPYEQLKSAMATISTALDNGQITDDEFLNASMQYKNILKEFAKKAPQADLVRVIKESKDEELRLAAENEIKRRNSKQQPEKKKGSVMKAIGLAMKRLQNIRFK